MSLPTPIGRQREVLYLPATGHLAVLGTAGSGKTTLAILRSAYLADPGTDHAGMTLLVTFNRALVTYLKHLHEGGLVDVVVENYHKFARGYLRSRGKMCPNNICRDDDERISFITAARQEVSARHGGHPLFGRDVRFFSEEVRWMAQHGISSLQEYISVERIGRVGARVDRRMRDAMFEVYEAYRSHRQASGKAYDWDDLAAGVCDEFDLDAGRRRYRHVVIDEGQDFSPQMLRSLAKAIPSDGSLTFFGDVAQQIYGQRMSWRSAGLEIAKEWRFEENYRNSKQIARLGLAIAKMPYFRGGPDLVEPVSPKADGPLPTLVKCSSHAQEVQLVVREARQAGRTQSVAVLFRNRDDEQTIPAELRRTATRLHRELTTWQAGPGVRFGTYHAAKGLEFDTVILPFITAERIPDPEDLRNLGKEEATAQDGRLLYVGVTRAKTRLIMTYSGEPTSLLPMDPGLYESVAL